MKASELIKLLQIVILKHGDRPVMISDHCLDYPKDIEQLQATTVHTNTIEYAEERVFLLGQHLPRSVIYTEADIPEEPEPSCPELIDAFNSKEVTVTAEIKGVHNGYIQ